MSIFSNVLKGYCTQITTFHNVGGKVNVRLVRISRPCSELTLVRLLSDIIPLENGFLDGYIIPSICRIDCYMYVGPVLLVQLVWALAKRKAQHNLSMSYAAICH